MYSSVRAARPWVFLFAVALAIFARPVAAQETGKIQGRVTDAASGQPIAGAQVYVAGTRLGNITNAEGFYFINNVPAGLLDISAEFIGYQAQVIRQQRVLAGQTITLDFRLIQSAVQIAALEIIGETQPLVPRDQVASKAIVTGQTVQDLPIDDVRQVVTLQPGVIDLGNVGKGISIRGGRSGEEAVYIDGVLVRNFHYGNSNLRVGVNSLSEVDVLTGGFSAEYGDAQSGIINYVTRSSGRQWNGALGFQTDELSPNEWSRGLNRLEFSLGGPVMGNLGFFGAMTAEGRSSANTGKLWRDVPVYIAEGVDTVVSYTPTGTDDVREVILPNFVRYDRGGQRPFTNSDQFTFDSKLDYTYGSGSRVFVTGKFSREQTRGPWGGTTLANFYNPSAFTGTRVLTNAFILGWTHNFVQSADQALALDLKVARTRDQTNSGVLDREWDLDNRSPFMGFAFSNMQFLVNEKGFPVDEKLIEMFLRNTDDRDEAGNVIRRRTPFDPTRTELGTASEFRINPYGITDYNTRGPGGTFGYNLEEQLQFRATVDWQVNRQNRLKFGGDYTDIDTRFASVGYQSLSFAQMWVENPKRASLFVQDRLDLGDVVIEGGLRYDRFDPNTNFAVTPGYFNLDDPTSYRKAPAQTALSPRLGVSFPVTVNSTFRLSYGHFAQVPDLNEYYFGKNTDFFRFRNTNTNDRFATPAKIGKTIAFEFGYRQLLGPDFVLDISAFNRDKTADATYRKLAWSDPTYTGAGEAPLTYLNTLTNSDFGTIRGVDVRADRRFGRVLNIMLGYSYQDARSTGTDPLTFTNLFARIEGNANTLLGLPPNPAQAMRLTEENRKHNVTGNFALNFPGNHDNPLLRNFGVFGTLRFVSGLPYSPVTEVGDALVTGPPSGLFSGELRDDEISTARTPWIKDFDLKASKGLRLMGWSTQLFVDARNVLDFENRTSLFLTTGDVYDEPRFNMIISAQRETLGGGQSRDNIDLSSLARAGQGVRNDVDLVALRRAEARFGNGDGIFSADEQIRAFRASLDLSDGPQTFIGAGRRVRLGFELTF